MQMLLLVLSVLFSSLAEGRLVDKCELRDLLMAADLALPQEVKDRSGLSDEDFMAKIVCHVELTTGFDTNTTTVLKPDEVSPAHPPGPHRRRRRGAGPGGGKAGMSKYKAQAKLDSREDFENAGGMNEVWNLFGIFQFSDHIICSAGPDAQTPNLCEMNCSDLIDNDITDDINCIETIKVKMQNDTIRNEHGGALMRMTMLLFQKECYTVLASDIFHDC